MDLRATVDAIWEEQRNGIHFPADWRGKLGVEDAYRVQLGILARRIADGAVQAGWKVGLTAQVIREQVGYHEPVLGYLLLQNQLPSGAALVLEELYQPCLEPELCLTLGETLHGPGITPEQARQAISAAAPALEVVERRGDFVADIPLSITDDIQQRYFVTGAPLAPLPPGLALSSVALEYCVNGQRVESAKGAAVLGGPEASVAWLANRLADFGRKLERGMQVMTGSFTKQLPVDHGDVIEARFAGVGTVTLEFT